MAINKTCDEYLERLLKLKRNVYVHNDTVPIKRYIQSAIRRKSS